MSEKVQYIATGRRKKSIARVRMLEGSGVITVNKRPFAEYFNRESHRLVIMQPMELVKLPIKYDIYAKVEGGGGSGQAGAMKLGIARALVKIQESLKSPLKSEVLDPRSARPRAQKIRPEACKEEIPVH